MSNVRVIPDSSIVTKADIESANESKTLLFFPNLVESHVTWDEVIQHLNTQHNRTDTPFGDHNEDRSRNEGLRHVGGLEIRSNFHIISMAPQVPGVFRDSVAIMDKLESIYGRRTLGASGLINFVTGEAPIMLHEDRTPSFYWHGIGTVEWRRYETNTSEEYDAVQVTPGDSIYVPPGMWHTVHSTSPRFAISFEQLNYN
jgi:mannose-6-phosphate isomerase-like protein (cupin superfamily)